MNLFKKTTAIEVVLEAFNRDGYVVIEDALAPAKLAELNRVFDAKIQPQIDAVDPLKPSRHLEIKRCLEQDAAFEDLMDWPAVFPIARAIIGADITLATAGEGDYRPARTPAYIAWHNDFIWMPHLPYPRQNFWVRCSYFLNDVTVDRGPFTLLPGTHRATGPCPKEYNEGGQPRAMEGMVHVTGPAGACLINNTEIYHTSWPNLSDQPRKLIMILYKHAWMRQWMDGYDSTPEFAARQTSEARKQLCGFGIWHREYP
ncbi:MAG: phytanoyl-CoA dioxygenase family protein [Planctomycetes bacterium]|nr:phytanoyl-CoA dioxygenase family protein [Planctomycetota bacterium]